MFSNKKEETDLSFSVVKELIQDLNIHIKALGFVREWNMIAFVLISDCSVNKCNLFPTFCISGVVLPMSVVCSWGGQDQYSWCVICQSECVSWRVQGHCFGGLCVVIVRMYGFKLERGWMV